MILLNVITKVDGDARLINYLGLVRGSSQRLVKSSEKPVLMNFHSSLMS